MKVLYTAKNYSGQTKSGEMEVKDERDLAVQLRNDGFILTSFKKIDEENSKKISLKFFDRFVGISLKDKLMFTQNMSVMISSGLPISRAVKNIVEQSSNKRLREIMGKVFDDLQAGMTFADGLSKFPGVFDELFVNMIRVGEASGNLEEILEILTIQLAKEHDLKSKVKGAMTYPAVIIVVMVAIAILMLTYILPKMMAVFSDMDVELPASTQFIIGMSNLLRSHPVFFGIGGVIFIVMIQWMIKTPSGRKALGFLTIRIPVVKKMVIEVNCARFARIYSSLLKSGVSVVESLRILSNTLTNFYFKAVMLEALEDVQKGVNLSKIIRKNSNIFPLLVSQMMEVGEETGKTETVLLKLAEFYEDDVNQMSKNMSSIIEPVLMVFIGGAVGFFAVSMLQPMYGLMENIK